MDGMTLREIFNSILDHPIQFEFNPNPWGVVIGIVIGAFVWVLIEWRFYR